METAGILRWSSDAVPLSQRLDYWIGVVCEAFLELDVETTEVFTSTLELALLESIGVSRVKVEGGPQRVRRTSRAIARASGDRFYLQTNLRSAWRVTNDQWSERLLPGDLLLVDSRRPHEFHFGATHDIAVLSLPVDWVQRWLVQPEELTDRRIDGSTGWGAALSHFLRQLTPELTLAPPLPAPLLVDQLGGLLALASGAYVSSMEEKAVVRELPELILRSIRERLAEAGLTAAMVAVELGISERTVHRCLMRRGTTFARSLLACRLEMARTLLMQARFDRLTVAAIGRRVGFTDASHFVHLCRRHLGSTPAALRRAR